MIPTASYYHHPAQPRCPLHFCETQLLCLAGNTATDRTWLHLLSNIWSLQPLTPQNSTYHFVSTWLLSNVSFPLFSRRTMERHRCARGDDFDYPPMDSAGFSPSPHPPPWLEPPPPYEVAIKTTCSSTHLRRAYSDTHLASEPLFGQSREISFEVWRWTTGTPLCTSDQRINRHETGAFTQTLQQQHTLSHLKHVSSWCWPVLVRACFPLRFCNYNAGVNTYLNIWWN